MTRILLALAVTFAFAAPAMAQGPTHAAEINVELTAISTRAEAEALYPGMSAREIDLLMHRICEIQSMAAFDL